MTITYTQEPLSMCRSDIEGMLPEQWAETGDSDINCAPNWAFYEAIEAKGALILLMAREDGVAIGYLAGMILPHPNSMGVLVANIQTFFIKARANRALLLRSLISHGMGLAGRKGVYKISVETEYNHSAGRIFEAMGLRPASTKYVWKREMQEAVNA